MQAKSIAECSKLPFVIKIFALSISEWPFYTGFTVIINQKSIIILKFAMEFTNVVIHFHYLMSYIV